MTVSDAGVAIDDRPGAEQLDQADEGRVPAAAVLFSLAIAAEIFSGNWGLAGSPIPLDRVLMVLALGALLFGGASAVSVRRLRFRPIHVVLLVAATYATASAIGANTFSNSDARFALLDRFGILPFLMFVLAPLVFDRPKSRRFLLAVLIAVGAYLGIVNFLEIVGPKALVFPSYITDRAVGLHFGRARGPFVEAVADGLSLYMCAVAAAIGLTVWRTRWIRVCCMVVIALAAVGVLLTLTRAVWIAAVVGTLIAMVAVPKLRRFVLVAVVVGAIGVLTALAVVPGLQDKASSRADDQFSVWDRLNTDRAAISMAMERPLIGFGWQTFEQHAPDYLRQADDYPLTGTNLEVHNVFLSHAAELGFVGAALWAVALLGGVGGAIVRRGPPSLYSWRIGLLAIFVAFLVVANFGPLSYPLPNLLLWTWAGIAGAEFYLAPARAGVAQLEGSTP
jgi:O-antigen ligase